MNDAEKLLRELEGTLVPERLQELEESLDARPEFDRQRRRWRHIAGELTKAKAVSFRPMFADRVLSRIREARRLTEDTMYMHLRWMFARVVLAGVALALILGVYNATGGQEFSHTAVETLFGLPAPSLESVVMLADA